MRHWNQTFADSVAVPVQDLVAHLPEPSDTRFLSKWSPDPHVLSLTRTHTFHCLYLHRQVSCRPPSLLFLSSSCRIPPLCPLFLQVTSSAVSHSNAMVMSWPLSCPAPLLCSSLHPSLVNNLPSFFIFIFPPFCGHFIMLKWSCTD